MTTLADVVKHLDADTQNVNLLANQIQQQQIPNTGGSVKGRLTFTNGGSIITRDRDNDNLLITGGSISEKGSYLHLYGAESESNTGCFILAARDTTQTTYLKAWPNNQITFANKHLCRSVNNAYCGANGNVNVHNVVKLEAHNTNLNNILDEGTYNLSADSAVDVQTDCSYPMPNWGLLKVDKLTNYIIQQYIPDNDPSPHVRFYNTNNSTDTNIPINTWTKWYKNVYLVDSYQSGVNWYRKWSDGWIEQGGWQGTLSTNVTVTLNTPFTTTNYTVTAVSHNGEGTPRIGNITTTKFQWQPAGAACKGSWYACGR